MMVKKLGWGFWGMMSAAMLWYSGCCVEIEVSDGVRRRYA